MFLTAAGSVYACGKNQSGQLGLGQATELVWFLSSCSGFSKNRVSFFLARAAVP